jgi:hypothetical protein
MNLKYTIALLTFLTVFYFVPASAQTKKTTDKKQPAKTAKKPAAKPVTQKRPTQKTWAMRHQKYRLPIPQKKAGKITRQTITAALPKRYRDHIIQTGIGRGGEDSP